MNMAIRGFRNLMIGALCAGAAAAQAPGEGLKRSTADAFALGDGSSFSASAAGPARTRSVTPSRSKAKLVEAELAEALELVTQRHVSGSSANIDRLASGALRGMLRALDPHSAYYNPAEFAELLGEHNSEYSGTGS